MDPTRTLMDLDQALSDAEYSIAVDRLNAYYQWRLKGGFEPVVHLRGAARGDAAADRMADILSVRIGELS